MKIENSFLLGKKNYSYNYFSGNYSIDLTTGEIAYNSSAPHCIAIYQEPLNGAEIVYWHVKLSQQVAKAHKITALFWGSLHNYLGYDYVEIEENDSEAEIKIQVRKNSSYIALYSTDLEYIEEEKYIGLFNAIKPHYKQLKKKYAKENSQVFFRESLDGKISLFGADYMLVKNASVEDTLYFYVYRNGVLFASASFNKSDCKFDYFKKSVELKLDYNDKYTKIIDAYENTYDLISLAPNITPLTLTKRSVVQIYIQGESIISNYSGGTYWESEVDEPIDNQDALLRKYYFSKGPKYIEVNLQGFNYDINAVYAGIGNSDCWNAVSTKIVGGKKYKMDCSIKFTKLYDARASVPPDMLQSNVLLLSDGQSSGIESSYGGARLFKHDTYRIEIYTGKNASGTKLYQSDKIYGKDGIFTLAIGSNLYPMSRIVQPIPYADPKPNNFYLGDCVVEYQLWGRLLCGTDISKDGTVMYDLPYDDFANARRNYKKCIGITGFNSENSVIQIYQTQNVSENPTAYGVNDYGEYFIPPYTTYGQYFYPLARNSWANTSLWVVFKEETAPGSGFENWNANHYKEYTLKNSYHIADVIKALISKIDASISHEKTAEYSQFLYGHSGATAEALGGCDIYITQKTNVLKGEYDQAAQKAEIKLKQVMEMLRDCFRCYWFIDSQNRLRIEHVSYFMNGLSYENPTSQLDLTVERDKFNKLHPLFCQQEIEFDKTELASRYEFAWMDDVTDSMGNLVVDINDKYVQKDKTDEINIDGFTPDIDYMLFLPDDFSNDGFALILADSDKKVPIVHKRIKSDKQYGHTYDVYTQNWYASFNQLILHYMEDMPGSGIEYNNIADYIYVNGLKRCVKHNIEFPSNQLSVDVYKLITTDIGDGCVEEVTSNIDTGMTEVEVRYAPS